MSGQPLTNEDDECVRRYLKGDASAFEVLYERYRLRLYAYLTRSVSGTGVADELFQDVWVKVIASLPRYKRQGRFRSWLFSCAHNVLVDHYRKQRPVEADDASEAAEPLREDVPEAGEVRQRIEAALASLTFDQRQAFYLRAELGCSMKEIAEVQQCSLEAGRSRLRAAYATLQVQLRDFRDE